MKKYYSIFAMFAMMVVALSFTACSSDDDNSSNNNNNNFKQDYDILQINGVNYACYGYRSALTYTSNWDLANHNGYLSLPCGKLSDAQKGEFDIDYLYRITLGCNHDLREGDKLENYSPMFEDIRKWDALEYVSGSAPITDKQNDKYLTIRFDSFKFGTGSNSYTLNGTVQLDLDED